MHGERATHVRGHFGHRRHRHLDSQARRCGLADLQGRAVRHVLCATVGAGCVVRRRGREGGRLRGGRLHSQLRRHALHIPSGAAPIFIRHEPGGPASDSCHLGPHQRRGERDRHGRPLRGLQLRVAERELHHRGKVHADRRLMTSRAAGSPLGFRLSQAHTDLATLTTPPYRSACFQALYGVLRCSRHGRDGLLCSP